ncbi:MAG TPA: LamG-like jellyroll fold domain-containing protein [Candidatus Saccharimonadales bacterium]|nr:LamG-like jellyroll fold domain-containing protein [Candidatus Saccharimonadales bacterium]
MNLTDQEILDLNELCNAVVDERLTKAQITRLAERLAHSEESRQFYVRALAQSASLYSYASEMQTEPAQHLAPPRTRRTLIHLALPWVISSMAATVVLALWILHLNHPKPEAAHIQAPLDESVAQVTGSKDSRWAAPAGALKLGERLSAGQRVELASGFAELTFDSGARVVLEGPASLEINSSLHATLHKGVLKANVPPEAIGFHVSDAAVDVVDLGTEFTMIADPSGATDVLVLKGKVEAAPQRMPDHQTILLNEKESRHFERASVSEVDDSQAKFARYTQTVPLQSFAPPTGYVHWSFDEAAGRVLKAESDGRRLNAFDARLEDIPATTSDSASFRASGRWGGALKFDGRVFAKAAFPGISGNSPRTVAFWVRLPEDALLTEAYAMVGWRTDTKKLGSRPVHIGWNRNPEEGTIGVLRTDYGGGYALGATPLRDGHWHHIAVAFVPGEDPDTPVQVKQYVDGRREGEGHPSPPGSPSGIAIAPGTERVIPVRDTLFLGCRLSGHGQRKERFRGEMDELFIADRPFEPREIVELMRYNLPPRPALAQAGSKDYETR